MIGSKESTVRGWLQGTGYPRADTLVVIAREFNKSVDWLLGLPVDGSQHDAASSDSLAEDLAKAVADRVVRRGQPAALLMSEFRVLGNDAIEALAESVEHEMMTRTIQLHGYLENREARQRLNSAFGPFANPNVELPEDVNSERLTAVARAIQVLDTEAERTSSGAISDVRNKRGFSLVNASVVATPAEIDLMNALRSGAGSDEIHQLMRNLSEVLSRLASRLDSLPERERQSSTEDN
jgi:hypothetical protein